jgi:hypothetical protein
VTTTNSNLPDAGATVTPAFVAGGGVATTRRPAEELQAIANLTREIFGTLPRLQEKIDPESGDAYMVVSVDIVGSVDDAIAQAKTWQRRLANEIDPDYSYALAPHFV